MISEARASVARGSEARATFARASKARACKSRASKARAGLGHRRASKAKARARKPCWASKGSGVSGEVAYGPVMPFK